MDQRTPPYLGRSLHQSRCFVSVLLATCRSRSSTGMSIILDLVQVSSKYTA
jgi:hypothetical protein